MNKKTNYTTVATSQKRSFSVTVGTNVGYLGFHDRQQADIHKAIFLIQQWIKDCIISDRPYLNGIVETAYIVYGYPNEHGRPVVSAEPIIKFSGVLSPAHDKSLTDADAICALNEIADILGQCYGQTRIYVEFCSETWVRQHKGKSTPRQD